MRFVALGGWDSYLRWFECDYWLGYGVPNYVFFMPLAGSNQHSNHGIFALLGLIHFECLEQGVIIGSGAFPFPLVGHWFLIFVICMQAYFKLFGNPPYLYERLLCFLFALVDLGFLPWSFLFNITIV